MSDFVSRIHDRIKYQVLRLEELNRERIFGIGLSRTGTTTLCKSLELLGYKSFHMPPILRLSSKGSLDLDWPWWLNKYDAFSDTPIARFFVELDQKFPNSKFIQTVREKEAWLESCRKHFSVPFPKTWEVLNQELYGSSSFDRELFSEAYDRYNKTVNEYFQGRTDFIKINFCSGEGWNQLCSFLHKDVPDIGVPRENYKRYATENSNKERER
ncbi:MAG: sulfotransferase [Coleofasciculus sp. A1-SPW-01]|uniref:sulfotransferase family protein n=1 Tax=Coleofasciculus sp. A1-SPW-01 TaxID=3070819 RepID=UPI0033041C38